MTSPVVDCGALIESSDGAACMKKSLAEGPVSSWVATGHWSKHGIGAVGHLRPVHRRAAWQEVGGVTRRGGPGPVDADRGRTGCGRSGTGPQVPAVEVVG